MFDAMRARMISAENDIDTVMFNNQVKYCEEVIAEAASCGEREAVLYYIDYDIPDYRELAVESAIEVMRERGFEISREGALYSLFPLKSADAYVARW